MQSKKVYIPRAKHINIDHEDYFDEQEIMELKRYYYWISGKMDIIDEHERDTNALLLMDIRNLCQAYKEDNNENIEIFTTSILSRMSKRKIFIDYIMMFNIKKIAKTKKDFKEKYSKIKNKIQKKNKDELQKIQK